MTKLTLNEVTNGMEFIFEKKPDKVNFCNEKSSPLFYMGSSNPIIGSRLKILKVPYKENRCYFIDFMIEGDTKIYTTHWKTFRNHTRYLSGAIAPKPIIEVTSKGLFSGFDISVQKSFFSNYLNSLGFYSFEIEINFIGDFKGGKYVTTKMINEIKNSSGFEKKLEETLLNDFVKNEITIKDYIKQYDESKMSEESFYYKNGSVFNRYKAGKLCFEIHLTDTFEKIIENIKKQIQFFSKTKICNLGFLTE